jgi:hypothetical protein
MKFMKKESGKKTMLWNVMLLFDEKKYHLRNDEDSIWENYQHSPW